MIYYISVIRRYYRLTKNDSTYKDFLKSRDLSLGVWVLSDR